MQALWRALSRLIIRKTRPGFPGRNIKKGEKRNEKIDFTPQFPQNGRLASAVMMLAACGGGAGGGKDSGANVDVTGTVSFPLAEQVTFTGMTSYPVGSESDPNNRTIFKRLEEATNVHIDWTAIQADQWSDKITLNMSNPSTLTDFVFTADSATVTCCATQIRALLSIWRTTSTTICPTSRRFLRCTGVPYHVYRFRGTYLALPWIEQLGG